MGQSLQFLHQRCELFFTFYIFLKTWEPYFWTEWALVDQEVIMSAHLKNHITFPWQFYYKVQDDIVLTQMLF